VITGFNTDVPFEGVTYHVQTEDKGLETPLILSLVYVGGAIIASKRTPYEVGGGFDEQALTERLQRQHKLICAAIKAGRVEELKRMGGPNGAAQEPEAQAGAAATAGRKPGGQKRKRSEPTPPAAEAVTSPPEGVAATPPVETAVPPPVEAATRPAEASAIPQAREASSPPAGVEAPRPASPKKAEPTAPPPAETVAPAPAAGAKAEPEIVILATLADEIEALGGMTARAESRPPVLPADAPSAQAVLTPADDAVAPRPVLAAQILETPEDLSEELYLTLLDDEGDFRAGQLATVKVYVGRGTYGQRPEASALVTVKVLGTSFRPLILTAATDEAGIGVVRALLPRFTSGRAAIIIRAVAGDDSAEMRRIIHQ
jgi:hypothetical protein